MRIFRPDNPKRLPESSVFTKSPCRLLPTGRFLFRRLAGHRLFTVTRKDGFRMFSASFYASGVPCGGLHVRTEPSRRQRDAYGHCPEPARSFFTVDGPETAIVAQNDTLRKAITGKGFGAGHAPGRGAGMRNDTRQPRRFHAAFTMRSLRRPAYPAALRPDFFPGKDLTPTGTSGSRQRRAYDPTARFGTLHSRIAIRNSVQTSPLRSRPGNDRPTAIPKRRAALIAGNHRTSPPATIHETLRICSRGLPPSPTAMQRSRKMRTAYRTLSRKPQLRRLPGAKKNGNRLYGTVPVRYRSAPDNPAPGKIGLILPSDRQPRATCPPRCL